MLRSVSEFASEYRQSRPGRRSDPGADFPWDEFFTEYRRLERGGASAAPNTGGSFMSALSDDEQKRLLRRTDALYELLQPAAKGVRSSDGTLARWLRETTESNRTLLRTLSPGGQVRTMIEAGGGNLDNDAIAQAIADSIPDDLADQVVDALAERIKR